MTAYRLAVDTGGTFTDFCLQGADGRLVIAKEPSTPDDPSRAVLAGMQNLARRHGIDPREIELLLHGTTVATNALLEQKGARTALVTTRGFKDVIFIGRQNRPHLYNFRTPKPPPLVSRRLVFEVHERVLADGSVMVALQDGEISALVDRIEAAGVEAVAVCLLHAYANPVHERRLAAALQRRFPELSVSVSTMVLPEFREYERTVTTVINALVRPRVERYIRRLENKLAAAGLKETLFVMQSNGGVITAGRAREQSARTVLSGPAGGVLAGVHLARQTGWPNLITADMGGTSMDICVIDAGEPRVTTEGTIGGYPLRLPMLDIHTIGAGGGSIAWVDAGGALRVGPGSAGAVPGPACYGLGGQEPTVTDANLLLGRLDPAHFAGGRRVRPELAAQCLLEKIAVPLGLTPEAAAEGIIRVVNAGMVRAMRVVSVQRGYDPRRFTLVAFGGAGPLHAVALARELGVPRVLIPPFPGVTSAWGMLCADVRQDYSLTWLADLTPAAVAVINPKLDELGIQGRRDLRREGFDAPGTRLLYSLDLRYKGQSYELNVPVPDRPLQEADLAAAGRLFHDLHRRHYGHARPEAPLEIVTLRLTAIGVLPRVETPTRVGGSGAGVTGTRSVYLDGAYHAVPVYARAELGPDWQAAGPALITQEDTTTLIWPGDRAHVDQWGNIIIATGGQADER